MIGFCPFSIESMGGTARNFPNKQTPGTSEAHCRAEHNPSHHTDIVRFTNTNGRRQSSSSASDQKLSSTIWVRIAWVAIIENECAAQSAACGESEQNW